MLRKRESRRFDKNERKAFFTALATGIYKNPKMSIRKHANELKVNEKTMEITMKQDLSPDFKPLDYATWGVLENKINATFHPIIGFLKTAIEEERNKIFVEFILKA